MKRKVNYNDVTNFILPLCGKMRAFYEPYLINAYTHDSELEYHESYEDSIFILMKFSGDRRFQNIEDSLSEDGCIYYDIEGGSFVMFISKIRPCFIDDYKKILQGKYSEISDPAKRCILGSVSKKSCIKDIFEKSEKIKRHWENKFNIKGSRASVYIPEGNEVWPLFNKEKTVFNKKQILRYKISNLKQRV
jgi:hypothetical protein